MRAIAPFVVGLVTLAASSREAAADLPTPGQRGVFYTLVAEGMDRFPERVLLAYPWTLALGRATDEHAEVGAAGLLFSRRADNAKIWAARRDVYEEWKKGHAPPADRYDDKELQQFFASDKVVRCNFTPHVTTTVPSDSKVRAVRERVRAVSLTDGECKLEKIAESPDPDAEVVAPENVAPGRAGCASCSVGAREGLGRAAVAIALAAAVGLGWLGRRRASRRSRL